MTILIKLLFFCFSLSSCLEKPPEILKKTLVGSYSKAKVSAEKVEKQAEKIVLPNSSKFELETLETANAPLDPTLSHALFLSGKEDKEGDLMNKLASINIEALKLAKKIAQGPRYRGRTSDGKNIAVTDDILIESLEKTDINGTVFEENCPRPDPCDPKVSKNLTYPRFKDLNPNPCKFLGQT